MIAGVVVCVVTVAEVEGCYGMIHRPSVVCRLTANPLFQ